MRRVVLVARGELRLEDVPEPTPGAGEVCVRVEAVGICGSDLHGFHGVNDRRRPGTVMGHEISGTVERVGPGVGSDWLGRGVAVNPVLGCGHCPACRTGAPQQCPDKVLIGCVAEHPGGFAEVLLAPVSALVGWTGPAPLRWGAFAEPLAVGLHAVRGLDLRGREVLVIGSGAVGIAVALAAAEAGATVTVTDRDDRRAPVLRRLGLSPRPYDAVPAGARFGVVVDCVASDDSLDLALSRTPVAGTVVVVGLAAAHVALPVARLVQGDRVLRGSAQYSRDSYARAVRWLASGRLDVTGLLSGPVPLTAAPRLFETWDETARPVRTLLTPR